MGWRDASVVETNPKWMTAPTVEATATAPPPGDIKSMTTGEFVAGLPITRLAMGAASPLIAAAQLGANIGDKIVEATGGKPVVGQYINDKLQEFETAKQRGMEGRGNGGFDVMGLLGNLIPAGKVAGEVTQALPQAIQQGSKILTGAAAGGATAAATPVVNGGENFFTDKAKQTGVGAGIGGSLPVLTNAVSGVKAAIEPFYEKGREAIIGRALTKASGGKADEVKQALIAARELVPGSQPTVGQASQNAGVASLERAASAISPESTVAFQGREAAQNAARAKALGTVAGDDNLMAQAVKDRAKASNPLISQVDASTAEVNPSRTVSLIDKIVAKSPGRTQLTSTLENVKKSLYEPAPLEQRGKEAWNAVNEFIKTETVGIKDAHILKEVRTVLDRVKGGRIDADEALSQIKGLKGNKATVQQVLQDVKDAINAPDQRLRSNAAQLYQGARKNITDLLAAKAGDGSKLNEAISRELSVVMKSLDHQINKAEPAYGQFLKTYAEKSKPINQMQIGQEIENKATNAVGQINLNPLAAALSDKTAQRATGFKRATLEGTMTPQQMQTLNAVKDDLIRAVQARNMAGTAGSDTVKKLAYSNLIDQAGVPTFLREFTPTQVMGGLLERGANRLYGSANQEIAQKLAETLLSPREAARMMQSGGPSRNAAIIDALMKQGTVAGGTVAGRQQGATK